MSSDVCTPKTTLYHHRTPHTFPFMRQFPILANNAMIEFGESFHRHTLLVRNLCGSGFLFECCVVDLVVVSFFLFGSEERADDFDDMRRSEIFVFGRTEGALSRGGIVFLVRHDEPFVL